MSRRPRSGSGECSACNASMSMCAFSCSEINGALGEYQKRLGVLEGLQKAFLEALGSDASGAAGGNGQGTSAELQLFETSDPSEFEHQKQAMSPRSTKEASRRKAEAEVIERLEQLLEEPVFVKQVVQVYSTWILTFLCHLCSGSKMRNLKIRCKLY